MTTRMLTCALVHAMAQITVFGKRAFFTSFLHPDKAYRKITKAWRDCSNYAKLFLGEPMDDAPAAVPAAAAAAAEELHERGSGEISKTHERRRALTGSWGGRADGGWGDGRKQGIYVEPDDSFGGQSLPMDRLWPEEAEAAEEEAEEAEEEELGEGEGDGEQLDNDGEDDGEAQVLLLTNRPDMEVSVIVAVPQGMRLTGYLLTATLVWNGNTGATVV
jgi:hypothetical protein